MPIKIKGKIIESVCDSFCSSKKQHRRGKTRKKYSVPNDSSEQGQNSNENIQQQEKQ